MAGIDRLVQNLSITNSMKSNRIELNDLLINNFE